MRAIDAVFGRGSLVAAKAVCLATYLFAAGTHAAGTAQLSVDSPTIVEGNRGSGSTALNFTVTRTGETDNAVTLQYQTDDGSAGAPDDYTASPPTQLSFQPGQTSATVSVPVTGDVLAENTESLFLHLSGPLAAIGPSPTFTPRRNFDTQERPRSIVMADVNADGRPDLISANENTDNVKVRLNTTMLGATVPTYSAASAFTVGTRPYAVSAVDVDSDNRPDLVTANIGTDDVSVLLNTTAPGAATPSYAPASAFAAGLGPQALVGTDINNDGRADLAVTIFGEGGFALSVLLNTTMPGASSASYSAATHFVAGGDSSSSIAAADINGDGRSDLILTNAELSTVSVLLNSTLPGATAPSYIQAVSFPVGNSPTSVTTTDADGDGRPDLAVTNEISCDVSVLLNTTPAGAAIPSFVGATSFPIGLSPQSIASTDVNGDGRPDLAVAFKESVAVLINTATPGASTPSYVSSSFFLDTSHPISIAAGDVNGDGHPDLAIANLTGNNVSVVLNTTPWSSGAPGYAASSHIENISLHSAVTHLDVNGDGKQDLAVANQAGGVSVALNTTPTNGNIPSYGPRRGFGTIFQAYSVTTLDVNGDGRPDLAAPNGSQDKIGVLLNTTTPNASIPSYTSAFNFPVGMTPLCVTATDANSDGRPDLVTGSAGAQSVSVLINTTPPGASTPTYSTASMFGVNGPPWSVAAADINMDGLEDLVTGNQGNVSVLINTTAPGASTSSYATASAFAVDGNTQPATTVADFNSDGRPDVAVSNENGTVSVLLNTTVPGASTAAFATSSAFNVGMESYGLIAADLNNDGRPDLAVANKSSDSVTLLFNTTVLGASTTSFGNPSNLGVGDKPMSIDAHDINGDGRLDLAIANNGSSNVSVLLSQTAVLETSEGVGTILDDDDTTPDTFLFTDVTNVARSVAQTSNAITVAGVYSQAPISVSVGEYSIGCTSTFTSTAGSVGNGQAVCVRHTSSPSFSTSVSTILTIGGVSDTFTTTTQVEDGTPDAFTFADVSSVDPLTVQESNIIPISGINTPVAVQVVGGEYRVNGGTYTSAAGTLVNGDTVQVRHTSALFFSTATDTTLTVGGVSDTFTSTTRPVPPIIPPL